ncbi:MAG TPA: lipopolysaccharide biosynthesis protein [Burkholderiales bacterium]|nr:lipopolysaccharide biosynthesis protein [Burkholderiales bacterium]
MLNPLAFYAGLYAASAAALKFAGFVYFLWLARTLPVEEYAQWGLLYALQTGVSSLAAVGIVEAVIGLLKRHRMPDEQKRLFAAANTVFVASALCSAVGAAAIFALFVGRQDASPLAVFYVVLSGTLLAYASLQAQIVRLDERHAAALWFNFLVPLTGLAGSIAAFAVQSTVLAFFAGSTAGLMLGLAAAWLKGLGMYAFTTSTAEWRPIVSRVSPFIAVTFLGWLSGYGTNYIVKFFFDSPEVAKFTLVFMLSTLMQLVASATNQVWGPRFYRIVHDLPIDEVEVRNRRFYDAQGFALGVAGGLLIALYPLVARIVGGNLTEYGSIAPELFLLIVSYVILVPYWHCQNYLLAYDRGPSVMRMHLVTSAVGFVLMLVLIYALGPIGVYAGFGVQMVLRTAGAYVIARAHWPVRVSWWGIAAGCACTALGFAAAESGLGGALLAGVAAI